MSLFYRLIAENPGMFDFVPADQNPLFEGPNAKFLIQPFLQVVIWSGKNRYHSDYVTNLDELPGLVGYIKSYYSYDESERRAALRFGNRMGAEVTIFTIQDALHEAIKANNISAFEALLDAIQSDDDYFTFDELTTAVKFASLETVLHIMYTMCNHGGWDGHEEPYDALLGVANENPDKRVLKLVSALSVCVKKGTLSLCADIAYDEFEFMYPEDNTVYNEMTLFYNIMIAAV